MERLKLQPYVDSAIVVVHLKIGVFPTSFHVFRYSVAQSHELENTELDLIHLTPILFIHTGTGGS